MKKEAIIGLSLEQLQERVEAMGLKKFVGKQLAEWAFGKRIADLDQITNISKKNIEAISEQLCVGRQSYSQKVESADGTKKYLFETPQGNVESVVIPDGERQTLCVSSQVGCKMNCAFCMTGKCGFSGNLSTAEIMNQILSIDESAELTNIVFMGMGEPFDNLENVIQATNIMNSEWGFGWSPKRITVSTSGLIKGTREFLDRTNCHLAISLHNPFPEERAEIMPIERSNSITELIELLRGYDFSGQRRLSFEYILFEGLNDSMRHARGIVELLRGLNSRVNLISFHEVPGLDFRSPDKASMERFRDYLSNHGITSTIRRSRGKDIEAACGQLKNKSDR